MPFGMGFGGLGGGMDPFASFFNQFANMGMGQDMAANQPGVSYNYSSSYSSTGPNGVTYEQTSSTRRGPGGVRLCTSLPQLCAASHGVGSVMHHTTCDSSGLKSPAAHEPCLPAFHTILFETAAAAGTRLQISESRSTLRDGRTGEERMRLTRGLGDRQRTLERSRRGRDLPQETHEELQGMSSGAEAQNFDQEWQQAARANSGLPYGSTAFGQQQQQQQQQHESRQRLPRGRHGNDIE